MASKISKSEKIRKLLKQGLSVKDVAKRLRIKPGYVYTVSWKSKLKQGNKIAPVQEQSINRTLTESEKENAVIFQLIGMREVKQNIEREIARIEATFPNLKKETITHG